MNAELVRIWYEVIVEYLKVRSPYSLSGAETTTKNLSGQPVTWSRFKPGASSMCLQAYRYTRLLEDGTI
jgi:hypothetical protein